MPPFNSTNPKFNNEANMAPVYVTQSPAVVPPLSEVVPAGKNKANTFLEDAADVVHFTTQVCDLSLIHFS